MKALQIITLILVLSLINWGWYTAKKIDQLNYRYEELANKQNKDYLSIKELFTKSQEKKNHLNITVQKKVFNQEIAEAKKILSKKLKIEEDRIYFEDLKFSIT